MDAGCGCGRYEQACSKLVVYRVLGLALMSGNIRHTCLLPSGRGKGKSEQSCCGCCQPRSGMVLAWVPAADAGCTVAVITDLVRDSTWMPSAIRCHCLPTNFLLIYLKLSGVCCVRALLLNLSGHGRRTALRMGVKKLVGVLLFVTIYVHAFAPLKPLAWFDLGSCLVISQHQFCPLQSRSDHVKIVTK